jgi:hypothetical protein
MFSLGWSRLLPSLKLRLMNWNGTPNELERHTQHPDDASRHWGGSERSAEVSMFTL